MKILIIFDSKVINISIKIQEILSPKPMIFEYFMEFWWKFDENFDHFWLKSHQKWLKHFLLRRAVGRWRARILCAPAAVLARYVFFRV